MEFCCWPPMRMHWGEILDSSAMLMAMEVVMLLLMFCVTKAEMYNHLCIENMVILVLFIASILAMHAWTLVYMLYNNVTVVKLK